MRRSSLLRDGVPDMSADDTVATAIAHARSMFLDDDHARGCAETTLVALATAYGLADPEDPAAAMALNGGVAYRGGVCGAITGSAIAVGRLVARQAPDHAEAKRAAREIVARLADEFESEFGAVDCRALLGRDIRTAADHAAFIDSGVWRTTCLRQIEFAVRRLANLPGALPATGQAGRDERGSRPGEPDLRAGAIGCGVLDREPKPSCRRCSHPEARSMGG